MFRDQHQAGPSAGAKAPWLSGESFSLATGGGVLSVPPAPTGLDLSEPEQIGTYRIVDRLGEGGMGTVYLAEQLAPVRRQVALKVLKSAMVSERSLIRFEAEQQAMAMLSHPSVAQMFEAGTGPDGYPYFAMEHVPGVAITDYCDQHRLSLPERLALFRAVCDGVQHAHQKGILHRDLKPSNVLVTEIDGRAVPKIIDFGIAKAIDQPLAQETLVTGAGVVGTLGYLSPEALVSGESMDTRGDVYALGILLYELLVGVRPFDLDEVSIVEVLRRITEDEARSPSHSWSMLDAETQGRLAAARQLEPATVVRRLEGDLNWIVGKAVAKERDERYPSVAELSAEVGRCLRDEPVEAGPPGGLYRLRKLVRRHRGFVVAASLLLVSLAVGLVLRTVEARRANRQAETARQVTRFLVEMFQVSDPLREAGGDLTAREILGRGAQRLRDDLSDQPLVRAQLLDTMATVNGNLGLYGESGDLAREALALRRDHLPEQHPDLTTSLETLAAAELGQGRYSEAEVLLRQVVELREQVQGSEHVDLARPLVLLGDVLTTQDRAGEGVQLLRRALTLQEAALGPQHLDLAGTLRTLGRALGRAHDISEAEEVGQRSLAIREMHLGSDHALVADSLELLADIAMAADGFSETMGYLERALAIRESVYGADNPVIVRTLYRIGGCFFNWGRVDAAEEAYVRAVTIARSSGIEPLWLARALSGLAQVAWRREDAEDCLAKNELATPIFEAAVGRDSSEVGWHHVNIANCQSNLGRLEDAEASYLMAQKILTHALGADHPDTILPVYNLAGIYLRQGKLAQAETACEDSLKVFETSFGSDHTYVALASTCLGDIHSAREQWTEAERWYRRALTIREGLLDSGAHDLHTNLTRLAEVLRAMGRSAEAEILEARVPSKADAVASEAGAGDA